MKRVRFPIVVKRGSSEVKIYRDQKPEGTYYRVVYYLGSKRHRLNFSDLREATDEAEAKASRWQVKSGSTLCALNWGAEA